MDYDNQQTGIFHYDGGNGIQDGELSPEDNEGVVPLVPQGNQTFLVRLKNDSFLLVCAKNENEVVNQISRITNPKQTIITPFDQNFVLEFEPTIPPLQHVRDGPLVIDEDIPKFNFMNICLKNTFSNVQVACTDPEIRRVVQLPVHFPVLNQWEFFKKIFNKIPTKKKKKKGQQNFNPNQKYTIRDLKPLKKLHVEIMLRYAYSPNETPYEWIPSEEMEKLVNETDEFMELLNLSKKVEMLCLYQHLCHFFLKERLKNCDLTLPVYTSGDPENDPNFEKEKKHFEKDFFKKRFTINAEKILKVWEEVKGKGMKMIENYIVVYLIEHCIGSKKRIELLTKDILEFKGIKYYIQKDDVLLNLGRRKFESQIEKKIKKKKKVEAIRPSMTMMDDDEKENEKLGFPFKLSVCGDFNYESFTSFKKSLFPKVHEVEKEIIELYHHQDEEKLKNITEEESVGKTIRNITYERKREKEIGRKMRKAWLEEKEVSTEIIKRSNDEDDYCDEEYFDLIGNKDLMRIQLKSNRFLLSREEYKDAEDDSDEEVERICTAKNCNKVGTNICSRCRKVYYCGVECQRKDWKGHKKGCKK